VTGRGRHTSSSSICLKIESPEGTGWVIDTPGIRSFGLGHVNPNNILGAFPDLAAIAEECPRGCTHLADAPDCNINDSLQQDRLGAQGQARVESLQRLLTTFSVAP
jgi:ribosome biogenesis GTPase